METEIIEVIKALAKKAKEAPPHEALHLTQAALNLAQVLQIKKRSEEPS
jgi:hypothetical protein